MQSVSASVAATIARWRGSIGFGAAGVGALRPITPNTMTIASVPENEARSSQPTRPHVANVNPPNSASRASARPRRLSASASTARAPSNMLTGTRLNRFSGVAISTKAAATAPTRNLQIVGKSETA